MNGASAEPCANTSRPPNASISTISGASQYFFRCRVYFQSSDIKPPFAIAPPVSELTLEVAAARALRAPHPRALRRRRPHERIAPEQPHQDARRCEDHKVQDAHDDGRRDLRDRGRQPIPGPLHRAEPRRRDQAGQNEERADPPEPPRDRLPSSPEHDARQHEKRDADRERKLPPRGGRQSSWNWSRHASVSFHGGCVVLSRRYGPSTR